MKKKGVTQNLGGSTSVPTQGSASAPNWTPGPWHVQEPADPYTHIVRDSKSRYVCGCSQDSSGNADANARLIAAAPELYEALDALDRAGMIGGHDHPVAFCKCGNCYIRRVLAKARGTSPE